MMRDSGGRSEKGGQFVLATAAYNEEKHIGNVIKSVVAQTHRPLRWVIVSDGSIDRTDEIVKEYARQYDFIRLHRITEDHPRNFAAQVDAINAGVALLKGMEYEFIGNLDADVSMNPDYFGQLLERFRQDPQLGLGGGFIYERCEGGRFLNRSMNSVRSVAHAVQLFRRECFESVRAYARLPYGGPDVHAETAARMKGWHVVAFPDLPVFHHRPTGSAGGFIGGSFREGRMDYSLGFDPLFEIVKSLRRLRGRPYILGTAVRLAGFFSAYLHGEQRAVSADFIAFLRREQRGRVKSALWPLEG